MLIREVNDPRLKQIFVTGVKIDRELTHANVYVSAVEGASRSAEILAGLNSASGFLRRELGRRIHIHTLPELHFVYDNSIEHGASMSLLINQANALSDQTPQD